MTQRDALESVVPMVNRWLEGVHSAMKHGTFYGANEYEECIQADDNEDESSANLPPGSAIYNELIHEQSRIPKIHHKLQRHKDINCNFEVPSEYPGLHGDPTASKSLSTDDIPLCFDSSERQNYLLARNTVRESFDSTAVQRPFSPASTVEQLSLGGDEVLDLHPQFRKLNLMRRASDGMINPQMVKRLNSQWETSRSISDVRCPSRDSSAHSSRPSTPRVSGSSGGGRVKLPSLCQQVSPRSRDSSRYGDHVPAIVRSDDEECSVSSSCSSNRSEPHGERIRSLHPAQPQDAPVLAQRNVQHLRLQRRGSLPAVMSAMRHRGLPKVLEESPAQALKCQEEPALVVRPNLKIPRHRMRSRSLDGQLGTPAQFAQYKIRKLMEMKKEKE
ncbi:uncharacterized protein LOC116603767 [Nematostella vectensis]|uniref:uncharacterized protein LOC116603767 n=1 Tax=Nematostella vectensis TaxID=45351 RepID=UPI0020775B56|nr:uncharacterized protein LOC116603767 [Nematostella vectensis]XP_032221350.2 uncharacterized protein LOC116603767 [Nematostella vectensis]XP_032221351.2 uncharacterized protein LOC116603767 [Nematostella vectensis]